MVMYDDAELDLRFDEDDVDGDTPYAAAVGDYDASAIRPVTPIGDTSAEKPRRSLPSLASICVLGGVTAAPALAILGCVGLTLPATSALHQAAALLVCSALLWLGVALITAQGTRGAAAPGLTPDSGHHV